VEPDSSLKWQVLQLGGTIVATLPFKKRIRAKFGITNEIIKEFSLKKELMSPFSNFFLKKI
jgi:hypothetical protein